MSKKAIRRLIAGTIASATLVAGAALGLGATSSTQAGEGMWSHSTSAQQGEGMWWSNPGKATPKKATPKKATPKKATPKKVSISFGEGMW